MIELANVSKVYHMGRVEVAALRGVDLNMRQGKILAIMGPSDAAGTERRKA